MTRLAEDLRYALRQLRRAPTFAATVVLILGIGIGMATAMFSIFRAVVLRKLPVRDPDRVVVLWTFRDPTVELPVSVKEVDDLRRQSRTLTNVAGFVHWGAQAIPLTDGGRPIEVISILIRVDPDGHAFTFVRLDVRDAERLRDLVQSTSAGAKPLPF